jgi:hypothetical protein
MIKARGTTKDGRPFILLGLSAENCRRLLAGQPIKVDTQAATPAGVALDGGPVIAIVAAQTEAELEAAIAPLVKDMN